MEKPKLGEDPTTVHALEFTNRPLWLNFPNFNESTTSMSPKEKESIGLEWASQLGMSALNGFSVIFQQISQSELASPNLAVFISILHKTLMDRKVFDTEIIGHTSEKLFFFTHCSRNISGSFTVMGVNLNEGRQKAISKLPTATTGSTVEQYTLTESRSGDVMLNGKNIDWDMPIIPQSRTKKPNRLTTFTLPGRSVVFWVFSDANIKECRSTTAMVEPEPMNIRTKTGSEKLLQKLLLESVVNPPIRRKRDLELIKGHQIAKIFPEKTKLDPIQQDLLNKMATLINDLQRITNNITASTVKPLQEELKKDDPFPIKVSNIYEPQQREQMRQKCKIIAHTLEKQCLRDLDPSINLLPIRGLNMKRMRRSVKPQVVRQFHDNEDIRTNMILRDNEKSAAGAVDTLTTLLSAIYSPKKEKADISSGLVGLAPTIPTTPLPTTTTPWLPLNPTSTPAADPTLQATDDSYETPEILGVFTKVFVRVIDLVTRHVSRFWNAMIDD